MFQIHPRYYKLVDCGYSSPCWVWRGAKLRGYGQIWRPDLHKRVQAHILMWENTHGPIENGLLLDHLCHTRSCVNPGHLELVTTVENNKRGIRLRISDQTVERIRFLASRDVSIATLARTFGLSRPTVTSILDGTYWR